MMTCSTLASVSMRRAVRARGRRRSSCGDGAHAALDDHPGAVARRAAGTCCGRGSSCPVPGVSQPPYRPEKPSVTAYIALTQVALEAEALEVRRRPSRGTGRRTPGAAPGGRSARRSPRSRAAPRARSARGRRAAAAISALQRLVGAPVRARRRTRGTARRIAAWSEPNSR